jgi:hypothetical protein
MSRPNVRSVTAAVLMAALLSLAINAVRLYGERHGWAPAVFSTEPGGGNSPLSISFLVLPLGFWFGRRLAQNGHRPVHLGKALLFTLLGFGIVIGGGFLAFQMTDDWLYRSYAFNTLGVLAGLLVFVAWRRAWVTLVAYGLLARIPVAAIQFQAVERGWDVHFAKGPPGSNPDDALQMLTLAQLLVWPFGFTVLVGGLFAALGAATVRR